MHIWHVDTCLRYGMACHILQHHHNSRWSELDYSSVCTAKVKWLIDTESEFYRVKENGKNQFEVRDNWKAFLIKTRVEKLLLWKFV